MSRPATQPANARTANARILAADVLSCSILVALSLTLLWLAVPRSMAAWDSLQGDAEFDKIWKSPPPSDDDLQAGALALMRAVEWVPSERRLANLAVIEITQAQRLPVAGPERESAMATAEGHLVEGLALNPVDGYGWFTLAMLRKARNGPPREVAVAVLQSIDMAPRQRWLWLARAELIFEYASFYSPDELLGVQSQLRAIWETDGEFHRPLVVAGMKFGNEALLQNALGSDRAARMEVGRLQQELKSTSPVK